MARASATCPPWSSLLTAPPLAGQAFSRASSPGSEPCAGSAWARRSAAGPYCRTWCAGGEPRRPSPPIWCFTTGMPRAGAAVPSPPSSPPAPGPPTARLGRSPMAGWCGPAPRPPAAGPVISRGRSRRAWPPPTACGVCSGMPVPGRALRACSAVGMRESDRSEAGRWPNHSQGDLGPAAGS